MSESGPTPTDFTCDVGDGYKRWMRGMPKPETLFVPMSEDFYIYVIGSVMRYVKIESFSPFQLKVLRTFKHGFDGISALEVDAQKEVYAIAEKSINPKIQICKIKIKRDGEYSHKVVAKLTGIRSTEIRAMRFNKKEIIVVLTGYPTFSLSIWKWTTEEELMVALSNEPSEFADLLIKPTNDCHWIEYGRHHLTFYDLQSFTKSDIIKTQIYLPERFISYDEPDPGFGQTFAMTIVSACFTSLGDFFILDDQLGLHILNQEEKILTWLCSIGYGFLGSTITSIVPFGDAIAETHDDGWILAYDFTRYGKLQVKQSFKLSSGVVKYFQFPDVPDAFYAITEKEGLVEGVDEAGDLRQPFCIPDFLFSNVRTVVFIEPMADYCAVLSDEGRISILDVDTGDIVDHWRLPFRVASVITHQILPFMFCGTAYGCVNVVNIQDLQRPRLVHKIHLTKSKGSFFSKLALSCQGRYLIAGDTENDKIYLTYGYPFEEFEYLDSAKVPGEVRHFNVPMSGPEDARLQVMIYAKDKVEELCPSFIYNYSLSNDRLNLVSSQAIDNPVKAICFSPQRQFIYTYHVDKKQIGITPFCDDNNYQYLQEPEVMVEGSFNMDLNKMFVQGEFLYTFGEDGTMSVFEPPLKNEVWGFKPKLKLLSSVQTHSFLERGIAEGAISLDGTRLIAIGFDGTFTHVHLSRAIKDPNWVALGFVKPKLLEYQMRSYFRDLERIKKGKKMKSRMDMIRVLLVEEGQTTLEEDQELSILQNAEQSQTESKHLGKLLKQQKKILKNKGNPVSAATNNEEEWECDEWGPTEGEWYGEDEDGHHPPRPCLEWAKVEHKRRRSEIRRELEEEAQRLREDANDQQGDDLTLLDDNFDDFDAPPSTLSVAASESEAAPPEKESKAHKTKETKKKHHHKHLKQRPMTQQPKKFKNIKSKAFDFLKEKGTPSPDEAQEVPEEADEQEDADDFWGTHRNAADDINDDLPDIDSEEDVTRDLFQKIRKSMTAKDFKKGDKFFEMSQSIALRSLETEDTEKKELLMLNEGLDSEGIECVGYALKPKDIPGPEFWSRYEHTLMLRQYQPKADKLMSVVQKMFELFQTVQKINASRDPLFRVEIWEFNLDDEIDDILEEKGTNFAKYCHIRMMARNKLRHDRIDKFKDLLWNCYIYKGKFLFSYNNPLAVMNFPIKSYEATFGTSVKQCQEERRLELRMELMEGELVELGKLYTMQIIRSEIQNADEASHHPRGVSEDMTEENQQLGFPLDEEFNEAADEEEEAIRHVFKELGITTTSTKGKLAEGMSPHMAKVKERIAFGSILPARRHVARKPKSAGTLRSQSKHRRKKMIKRKRSPSQARLRMQSRQRRIEPDMALVLRASGGMNAPLRNSDKGKNRLSKLLSVGYTTSDYSNATSAAPTDDEDFEEDDDSDSDSNYIPSKRSFLDTIKPNRAYIFARGIFGPKGGFKRHKDQLETLMGPDPQKRKKKKKKKGPGDEAEDEESKRKGDRKDKKGKALVEFVILSDEEFGGTEDKVEKEEVYGEGKEEKEEEEEAWEDLRPAEDEAFIALKNAKIAALEEELVFPYISVERIFAGNLQHELQEMFQYQANPYRYHQMELKARHHFVRQIWLTQEEIFRLKAFFDKFFEQVIVYKSELVERMRERNTRIREIYYYLNLDLDIVDDRFDVREDVSFLFTVEPEEIPIEKYYTSSQLEEMRLAVEAERYRLEEEREIEVEMEEEAELKERMERELLEALLRRAAEEEIGEGGEEEAVEEEQSAEITEQTEEITTEIVATSEEEEQGCLCQWIPKGREWDGEERDIEWGGEAEGEWVCVCEDSNEEEEEEEEDDDVMDYLLLPGEKRDDLLLKQIPRPEFMNEKSMMEYTLEEFMAAREYREKREILEEVKARLAKKLQHELHQLYRANSNDYNSIDMRMKELFMTRVQFYYNILMEECGIMRLVKLMRITDDCQKEEDRVNAMLMRLQEEMKSIQMLGSQLMVRVNDCKAKETVIADRQNDLERRFRRDLGDVGYMNYFIKNYKRKPKIAGKNLDKAEVYEMGVNALKAPNLRQFGQANGEAAKAVVMAVMDIEDPMLMPPGCPRTIWDRFCKLRRKRLSCDFEAKSVILEKEHISKGLEECNEREDMTAKAMAAVLSILSHRTEMRNYFLYNTEFQYVTGKGNVEIDFWNLPSHEHSVMMRTENIENFNTNLVVATDRYIMDTKRCIFVYRDIRDIEWKFKAMHRTRIDLKQLLHDVNMTKPGTELLHALRTGIDVTTIHQDRLHRVRALLEEAGKRQNQYLAAREKQRARYNRQIKRQNKTNKKLKEYLDVENRETSLLKHAHITVTPDQRCKDYNERVAKFLMKGYMLRKIHENYQTIEFLETELARYYQKSFPCL